MDSLDEREQGMIDFMSEINKTAQLQQEKDRFKNTPEAKKGKLSLVKKEAKGICLDKIFNKIYQDALPISPEYKSGHTKDLEDEFRAFTAYTAPKGLEYYVRESIKKGNKAGKVLLESVEDFVNRYFFEQELNIDKTDREDIKFDADCEKAKSGIQQITDKMGTEEISDVIQNNVKQAAVQDIVKQKERDEQLRKLAEELKNDPAITTEAALERELTKRNIGKGEFYEPSLFEGIMVNKTTLLKESGVDLSPEDLGKKAFVESVKEMTGLSVFSAMDMIPFNALDRKQLGYKYARMGVEGSAVNVTESTIDYYKESGELELFEEGANLEIRRIFKDNKKELVAHIKAARKCVKAYNYTGARKQCERGREILERMQKDIQDIDASSIGSVVLGFLVQDVMFIGRKLIAYLLGPIGFFGLGIIQTVKRIQVMIDEHQYGKDYWDGNDWNFYRNGILVRLNEYHTALRKVEAVLGKAEDGKPLKKEAKKEIKEAKKAAKK